MPRIGRKAAQELARGAVSLEFAVPGWRPTATLQVPGGRQVRMYRMA